MGLIPIKLLEYGLAFMSLLIDVNSYRQCHHNFGLNSERGMYVLLVHEVDFDREVKIFPAIVIV